MIIAAKAATNSGGVPYLWVLSGNNLSSAGVIYTSTSSTASSWTSRTTSFGATDIRGLATDGRGNYVAVGAAGKLATSPDGITWTQRTSSFGTTDIEKVFYGNGYWVAVGGSGKLATATDPTGTWTQRTSGHGTNKIQSIVYGGEWVSGSSGGTITSTTSNPTTGWTSRTSTLAGGVAVMGYLKQHDLYFAGQDSGTTGAFATSPDGITWTARASADSLAAGTYTGNALSNATVTVTAMLLSDGLTGLIQTSTNGTTWTARTEATGGAGWVALDENGLFAVVSNNVTDGRIQTSTDGTTWTDRGAIGSPLIILPQIVHSSGTGYAA